MRILLQRTTGAKVEVDGKLIGQCGHGFLILVCAMAGDTEAEADKLAARISKLRVFKDEAGKMNRSILDVAGSALVVSQFTLAADTSRGNRPPGSPPPPPRPSKAVRSMSISRAPCKRSGSPPSRPANSARIWP